MSVIFVFVGQCGNQLGEQLVLSCSKNRKESTIFHPLDGFSRAVMVDSEPKVVEQILARDSKRKTKLFRTENGVTSTSGRGNNWAQGYTGKLVNSVKSGHGVAGAALARPIKEEGGARATLRHATDVGRSGAFGRFSTAKEFTGEEEGFLFYNALRALHKETMRVEDCAIEAIVVVHSLAGGTGSGLGSRLIEAIHNQFTFGGNEQPGEWCDGMYGEVRKALYVGSVAVGPRRHGETAVQSINAVMSLSFVQRYASFAILLQNEEVDYKHVSTMADVNVLFSQQLSGVFQYGRVGAIASLVVQLCPDGQHKFITVVPQEPRARVEHFRKSGLCSMVFHPGGTAQAPDASIVYDLRHPWMQNVDTSHGSCVVPELKGTFLAINQGCQLLRDHVLAYLRDAKAKCDAGAYIWRFEAAGVPRQRVAEAIKQVAAVMHSYQSMA